MDNDEIIITCHKGCRSSLGECVWRPSFDRQCWRTCSYCGSMHPEDLLEALENGAKLSGSDWKYGWPHKFYIDVPNPEPKKIFELGSLTEGGRVVEKYTGTLSSLRGKWYNDHLLDEGVPYRLFRLLEEKSKIHFEIRENQLYYRAPHDGYQAWGD